MTEKIGIYPGTFDPITLGHIDIINRARRICDKLIIAIAVNHAKTPFFTDKERIHLIEVALQEGNNQNLAPVEIYAFDGLLVDFAKEKGASFIIRGLRTVSDFDYEFQMVGVNRHLDNNLETIFLPADMTTHFISSSLAKQIFHYKGDLSAFIPKSVIELMEKMRG